ncbi:LD-carboxypeptidase [Ornithobacterium rhinotracheale]|uniref:LD-carboxypeptidase n=1 Tax=Ornithobacterium rhinotracheale TaxID=28251 RepID=A0A410JUS0_ORNRH|nr:LD-carboxypeptidase [Ornithobacterium rhinotracheale]QAR31739.1 LD-carboxypeptidase [Ornithobacterium rhinotracheale]
MTQIPPLHKGAKIGVIAPAGRIKTGELDFAQSWCQAQGWTLQIPNGIYAKYDLGYWYAGPSEHRLQLTQSVLDDTSLAAIWCARGGYGSVQIIDALDFSQFKKQPKYLIGYSDITVFHNHLNNLGIPTLHAVTAKPLNTKYSPETYQSLIDALRGKALKYHLPSDPLNILGEAKGKLVGGNLSIIYSQLGSQTAIQGEDLILFIEDWYENWYHIDRMLEGLKRSGLFHRVRGLICGSFTKMDIEEENPFYNHDFDPVANQVIHQQVKSLGIPVAFNFPAGHFGDNRALIMGAEVSFKVLEQNTILEFLD